MEWSKTVKQYIDALKPVKESPALIPRILSLVDLTRLKENDSESNIAAFCEQAQSGYGHVAAICVYPQFVRLVADTFANTPVKVATVVNFPQGSDTLDDVLKELNRVLTDGAQECDVVFPYLRYLAGEHQFAHTFVTACKAACGEVTLKMILETGVLNDPAIIADACFTALSSGADFVKTSTGREAVGATLESAATLLLVIKHASQQFKRNFGLKVSGGIKEIHDAARYIELADEIMGKAWVTSSHFRIGSSQLVETILKKTPVR